MLETKVLIDKRNNYDNIKKENNDMKKLVISTPFKNTVVEIAKQMVLENKNESVFVDEHKKEFEGLFIFIDKKPQSTLFTFTFPENFKEGTGKTIFVGNN